MILFTNQGLIPGPPGISTILIHHIGKKGEQRETSAREDNIDISIKLKKPPGYVNNDGVRFIAEFSKSRIPTKDLPLVANTEFQLTVDKSGNHIWTFGNVEQQIMKEVVLLVNEGMTQKNIAGIIGKTKARVSQIKRDAKKAGLLDGNL